VGGIGLPGERRGGVREEALLRERGCLLCGFGIRNFRRSDLEPGVASCGGIGDFAELGLFFPILLPRGEDRFVQRGRRALRAHERPVYAHRLRAFGSLDIKRLLFAVVAEEVESIEFLACEGFENMEKILMLWGVHKEILNLPEGGILRLQEGERFVQVGLKIPRLADACASLARMGQIAGIVERTMMACGMVRPVLGAPVVGVPLLQPVCGKRGGIISFNGERHILCLVARSPFRSRTGA